MREIIKSFVVTGAVVFVLAFLIRVWWSYARWAWERGLAEETVAVSVFLLFWWMVHEARKGRRNQEEEGDGWKEER